MTDFIITKFHPPCFKMVERFENLGNILRNCAKDKVPKSLVGALNRYEKQKKEKSVSLLENDSSSLGSRARF